MSLRFALVVSKFNPEVTQGLATGAKTYLQKQGCAIRPEDEFQAPGAFEIPLIAKKLAKSGKFAGVIALGCVIKGDTAHFEFISLGATLGIQLAILETEVPIAFGILTTYTDEQAQVRSRPALDDPHNKGKEAAAACFETASLLKKL